MIRTAALSTLLALSACAAPSRTAAPSTGSSSAPLKSDGAPVAASPLICRTERPTGSNYPRRVCYRQEELDAAAAKAQDEHRRATSSAVQPRRE